MSKVYSHSWNGFVLLSVLLVEVVVVIGSEVSSYRFLRVFPVVLVLVLSGPTTILESLLLGSVVLLGSTIISGSTTVPFLGSTFVLFVLVSLLFGSAVG